MTTRPSPVPLAAALAATVWLAPAVPCQTITHLFGPEGDGVHAFDGPSFGSVAADRSGNVYVTGSGSQNAFRVEPDGTAWQLIDATGDGKAPLSGPYGVVVDDDGDVFVAGGAGNNVFRIAADGTITEVLDGTGDGVDAFGFPLYLALGPTGALFASGNGSNNVFERSADGTLTKRLDASGDGVNAISGMYDVIVDGQGNLFATGNASDDVYRVTPEGTVTRIADATGDGDDTLDGPHGLAVDAAGRLYVVGTESDNVLRIDTDGTVTELLDATGAGLAAFTQPHGIVASPRGDVYVLGASSSNGFRIGADGAVSLFIDGSDGIAFPDAITLDAGGNLILTSNLSSSVLVVSPAPAEPDFRPGHRLEGEIAAIEALEDTDAFTFYATAETRLGFVARGLGKKAEALSPSLLVEGPDGFTLATSIDKGRTARIKPIEATSTGLHTLHVSGVDGTSGAYRIVTKGRFPGRVNTIAEVGVDGGAVLFDAVPGTELRRLRIARIPGKGEFAEVDGMSADLQPVLAYLSRGAALVDTEDVEVKANKPGTVLTAKGLALDGAGTHRLQIRGDENSVGFARVLMSLRFERGKGTVGEEPEDT